jgi:DNA-binding NarL/FixJ family response regulator
LARCAVLLEKHQITSQAIAVLLTEVARIEVLGICRSMHEACDLAQKSSPCILIVNTNATYSERERERERERGEGEGLDSAERIYGLNPEIKFIFYSSQLMVDPPQTPALGDRIVGTLNMSEGILKLLDLLQRWQETVPRNPGETLHNLTPALGLIEGFAPRERQLLLEIGNGQLNKQIARNLGLTTATIETYRKSVAAKLSVSGAELVRLAVIYRALRCCHHLGEPQPPIPLIPWP